MEDWKVDLELIKEWKWIYDPAPPFVFRHDALFRKFETMRNRFTVSQLKMKAQFMSEVAEMIEAGIENMDIPNKPAKKG